jgi:hypothetical protein
VRTRRPASGSACPCSHRPQERWTRSTARGHGPPDPGNSVGHARRPDASLPTSHSSASQASPTRTGWPARENPQRSGCRTSTEMSPSRRTVSEVPCWAHAPTTGRPVRRYSDGWRDPGRLSPITWNRIWLYGSRAPTEPAASQRYSHPMPSPSRSRSCASPCPSPAAMTTPGRTSARRCSPRSSARGRPTRLRDAAVAHFARYRRAAPTAGPRHRTGPGRYPHPVFGSSCHSDWTMRPQSGRSLSGRTGWAWRA